MSQDFQERGNETLRPDLHSRAIAEVAQLAGQSKLSELRRELDDIDDTLRRAIRDRIDVCVRVAQVKRAFDIPMMQPGRVGIVTQRARDFATDNDMSADFLEEIYRLLIAEACRVEDEIIDSPGSDVSADGER